MLLTRLDSPHVVGVYDHGEVDGLLYLAMQRIDGEDLGRILADRGPLPPAEALRLAMQLADGLADAHRGGVLHRDVKPSNVLVGSSGDEPFGYLCDFGIAKLEDADAGLTHTGLVAGTWAYLAPERARQQPASRASDLYSLGCVLWAMLTGGAPYRGSDADLLLAHQQDPVPQLQESGRLAEAVNQILTRSLAKEPADRYAAAGDLKAELRLAAAIAAEPGLEDLRPAAPRAPTRERPRPGAARDADADADSDVDAGAGGQRPGTGPTEALPTSASGWAAARDPSEVPDLHEAPTSTGGSRPAAESSSDQAAVTWPPPRDSAPKTPQRRGWRGAWWAAVAVLAAVVVGVAVGRGLVGGSDDPTGGAFTSDTASTSASAGPSSGEASPQGDPLGVGVDRVDLGCSGEFLVVLTTKADGDPADTVRGAIARFPGAPDPHYLSTADSCSNLSRIRNTQDLADLPYLGPFPDAASACRSRISHTDISTYVVRLDPGSDAGYLCACAYAAADLPDLDQTRDAEGVEGPRRFWTRGLQTMLSSVGHEPDPLTPGVFDQATADAVSAYQSEIGVPATGGLDAATWGSLQGRLCDD